MDLGDVVICSASPELLLSYEAETRLVVTAPIKGTAPRSSDPVEDAKRARELSRCIKNRAEHVMIVDLMRNDIGRVCVPGTIQASPLMHPMKLARIHHLVSEVSGRLSDHLSAADLLRAVYPGGSVTGAPKVAAMTFIDRLEPAARGVYCGALGRFSPKGDVALALPIRTATLTRKDEPGLQREARGVRGGSGGIGEAQGSEATRASDGPPDLTGDAAWRVAYGTGGGLVADSRVDEEYEELRLKARRAWEVLGGA